MHCQSITGMLRIFSFRDALTVPSQRSFNIIRKRYYAYVFGSPLIYAILPFATNSYGKNPGTYSCWIVVNDNWKDFDNAWKLVFFGFVLLAVCFTSYVFVYIFNKFSNVRVSLTFILF